MTTELTIRQAENGFVVSAEDFVAVIEDFGGQFSPAHLYSKLGELLYKEIEHAFDSASVDTIRITINTTKRQ